jgi:tRNA (mo5U34)-methyltransferase
MTPEAQAVLERVTGLDWYHTIDLPHGVTTPGYVDHRAQVALYGLPDDMRGLRALDVATYDGFWAFEMERRGAEVTAIDLESLAQCDFPRRFRHHAVDYQTGAAFQVAHELLGSRVERKVMSVYDLSPATVGTFDVVFLSDLLLHLRDPALALENVCAVTAPAGFAIVAEPYNVDLDRFGGLPLSQFGFEQAVGWWQHSVATLKTMMWAAGFDNVEETARFRLNCRAAIPLIKVVLRGSCPIVAPGQ